MSTTKRLVLHEVKRLSNVIHRNIISLETVNNSELTGRQFQILGFIRKNNSDGKDVYQKNIEEQFDIRPSTVAVLIKSLVRNGYIIRESVDNDLRLKKLIPTQKAADLHCKIHPFMEEMEDKVIQGLTNKELNTFFIIIDKMIYNINQ